MPTGYATGCAWPPHLLHTSLLCWPLPPFPYRPGVQGIMAVGIESETTTEAHLLREVLVGYAVEVVEGLPVRFLQLPQDLGER